MTFKGLILRFKPANRGQSRLFKAGLTGISGLSFRFIRMAIALISVPLTAKYLGAERYGLWLMLSTFLSWVSAADLGLAQSLKNVLATADGREDQRLAKTAISSTVGLTIIVSCLLGAVFWVVYPFINWSKIFNVKSLIAIDEAGSAMAVILVIFLAQLILTIPLEIYNAYQEGYLASIWIGSSNIISIGSLIIAINHQASLPILVISVFGTNLLGNIFAAIHIFGWQRPWLRPSVTYFKWREAFSLLKTGSQFWVAQITSIILLQTDLIIIAQLFDATEVAKYGVTLKLFALIGVIQSSFVLPLWSAYAEAFARQDYKWILKTFKHSMISVLAFTVLASVFLIFFGQHIIQLLTNKDLVPNTFLLLAMSCTFILDGVVLNTRVLMSGLGEVKIQALVGFPSSILNFTASILLGRWLGPVGVSLGTSISFTFIFLVYRYALIKRIKDFREAISA